MAAAIERPRGLTIVAALALLQGVPGLLRGFDIVRFGVDPAGQGAPLLPLLGLLPASALVRVGGARAGQGAPLLPLLGILTAARGGLVAIVALLYLVFAVG